MNKIILVILVFLLIFFVFDLVLNILVSFLIPFSYLLGIPRYIIIIDIILFVIAMYKIYKK